MRCEEIMKRELECASPSDTVQAAATKMRDANVGFLPVCDASRIVQGTITDRDLALRVLAHGRPASTEVADVMSREVIACRPSDDIRRAEELMGAHQKSRIMCIDEDGKLMGVISLSDLAHAEDDRNAASTMREVTKREKRAA